MIDQDEIRGTNPAKVQTERIYPKTIKLLGIARGDVAGDAFVEAKFCKEPERGSKTFLAVAALFRGCGEDGRARDPVHEGAMRGRNGGRRRLRHGASVRVWLAKKLCLSGDRMGRAHYHE